MAIGGSTPNASAASITTILRLAGAAGARSVRNEVERIGRTGVLGLRAVVEIGHAGVFVEHDVFEHRAEAVAGGVDLRLGFLRQLDALGVAAAFEIEDAVLAPAVLVVADQRAVRIGRQRGLAGAGQAEEDRGVAVRADIGRAVHRHHALGGQVVVQRGEHATSSSRRHNKTRRSGRSCGRNRSRRRSRSLQP